MTQVQIPDVIDDPVTKACHKVGMDPRFLFDRLANEWNGTGFSNATEVAKHWQTRWMTSGFYGLPQPVRAMVERINQQ